MQHIQWWKGLSLCAPVASYTWDHCILFHHYFLYFTFKFAAMCTIPVCTLEMFTDLELNVV